MNLMTTNINTSHLHMKIVVYVTSCIIFTNMKNLRSIMGPAEIYVS